MTEGNFALSENLPCADKQQTANSKQVKAEENQFEMGARPGQA
jgi:hypothetical protein